MDEFWQLGNAKYVFNGFFDEIQPGKAVGYAFFYKLAHILGWDSRSILLIGRFQTALVGCGVLALIYACARRLGESQFRALVIVLTVMSFSNFMERIFRTISEPLALLFASAALLMVLIDRAPSSKRILIAGVLSGLAFVTTQKAVYFNIALGLALVGDAFIARQFTNGIRSGVLLVLGWSISILIYCSLLGGSNPLPIAENLFFGGAKVATRGISEYGTLRQYVAQTLVRNYLLYVFCFLGMALALKELSKLNRANCVTLIFTVIMAAFIFMHDQPWPYIFIWVIPFMALWAIRPLDALTSQSRMRPFLVIGLSAAIAASFVGNVRYLRIDNRAQLDLVERAEMLLGPNDDYFDGTGMVADRRESTPLWLDRRRIVATLREGAASETFRGLRTSPPKVLLWSYRMDAIEQVIAPLIRHSYVRVAPNIRMPGQVLRIGMPGAFKVPIAGIYRLYDRNGTPVAGKLAANGALMEQPFRLSTGSLKVTLMVGPAEALLLPEGNYSGLFESGPDNKLLFAKVYD